MSNLYDWVVFPEVPDHAARCKCRCHDVLNLSIPSNTPHLAFHISSEIHFETMSDEQNEEVSSFTSSNGWLLAPGVIGEVSLLTSQM